MDSEVPKLGGGLMDCWALSRGGGREVLGKEG